jgi:hypothetical protein
MPRPHTRRLITFFSAVLAALVAMAWIASEFRDLTWSTRSPRISNNAGYELTVTHGLLSTSHYDDWQLVFPPTAETVSGIGSDVPTDFFDVPRRAWLPHWRTTPWSWHLSFPLWMPLAVFAAIATASAFHARRSNRRARADACVACGYPRTGLAAGLPCPECGNEP